MALLLIHLILKTMQKKFYLSLKIKKENKVLEIMALKKLEKNIVKGIPLGRLLNLFLTKNYEKFYNFNSYFRASFR